MALDAHRKQKKAEKRRAKEKAKRKVLAARKATGLGQRLARVAAAPVLHACTQQSLWDDGIAQVLVSRELDSGMVAFSVFLIDRHCLGVKDAFCRFMGRSEYFDKVYERIATVGKLVALQPATARKLVEDAAAYAAGLGLSPHRDYANAREIFGDINPADSDREFEFGQDGKPLFVAGPHDSPARCSQIVSILTERVGAGNFDFVLPVTDGRLIATLDREFADRADDDEWTIDGTAVSSEGKELIDEAHPELPEPRSLFSWPDRRPNAGS